MIGGQVRFCEEVVMDYFRVLCLHSPRDTVGNHRNLSYDKWKPEAGTTWVTDPRETYL